MVDTVTSSLGEGDPRSRGGKNTDGGCPRYGVAAFGIQQCRPAFLSRAARRSGFYSAVAAFAAALALASTSHGRTLITSSFGSCGPPSWHRPRPRLGPPQPPLWDFEPAWDIPLFAVGDGLVFQQPGVVSDVFFDRHRFGLAVGCGHCCHRDPGGTRPSVRVAVECSRPRRPLHGGTRRRRGAL
jgi:hypothetical protein